MTLALCIILLVLAVAICVLVMMQNDSETKLSGTIAGGSDSFFGKNKAKSMEGKLALATKVSAGVFIVCALLIAVIG